MKLDINYKDKNYNLVKLEANDKNLAVGLFGVDLSLKTPEVLKDKNGRNK